MTLSEEDRRLVGLWAADCAERVLPLFEAKAPSDTRPREATEGSRWTVCLRQRPVESRLLESRRLRFKPNYEMVATSRRPDASSKPMTSF